MRIWDIHPGYLNRQSLLGEHRELHGVVSILVNGRKGYARHPETLRWAGHGWALRQRHRILAAEMAVRGYHDRSPVITRSGTGLWPDRYLDTPGCQFQLLTTKYTNKDAGRIPLPGNIQQMWSQHKYSIMARDVSLYRRLGREIAGNNSHGAFADWAQLFTELLRKPPSMTGIRNALQHMWGYVSRHHAGNTHDVSRWPVMRLLRETQRYTVTYQEPYLLASTALSEFDAWLPSR